jgi:hypothetical protein
MNESIESIVDNTPEKLTFDDVKLQFENILIKDYDPVETRERKQSIIDKLPEDLFYHLKGRIHSVYFERERWIKEHPEKDVSSEPDEARLLRGELFEILVECDSKITPVQNSLEKEILGLLEDPERYSLLEQMGRHKNPDVTQVSIDKETGNIVINGMGEAKFGKIDKRAFHQLKSFRESLYNLVDTISDLQQPERMQDHNLKELAKAKKKHDESASKDPFMTVAENFKLALIIPAGAGASYDTLVKQEEIEPLTEENFKELQKHVSLRRSVFTREEVFELANYILSLEVL